MSLKDQVVLITGGSQGLGNELAKAFAQAGAKLVLVARGAEQLEATANELREKGTEVLAVPADLTDPEAPRRIMDQTLARFGGLHVLVNNAGSSARGDLQSLPSEAARQLMDLNFHALVQMTQAALPSLLAVQGGVINIGSLAAKIPAPYLGAYPATKHAVAAYSQQLRLELGPSGLKVLLVCPGPIFRAESRDFALPEGATIPERAQAPGGGVKVSRLLPADVAAKVVRAYVRGHRELILPRRARFLATLNQFSPRLGEWLIRKFT